MIIVGLRWYGVLGGYTDETHDYYSAAGANKKVTEDESIPFPREEIH
jgi:hypothetical protein